MGNIRVINVFSRLVTEFFDPETETFMIYIILQEISASDKFVLLLILIQIRKYSNIKYLLKNLFFRINKTSLYFRRNSLINKKLNKILNR